MQNELKKLLATSLPKEHAALLFSGGVDSTILAKLMKDKGVSFEAITVGGERSSDVENARKAAKTLGIKLHVKTISKKEVEKKIPELITVIGEINPVKTGVGLVKLIALEEAKKHGFVCAVTGSGADELFAGYARMRENTQEQCKKLAENYFKDNDYLFKIADHAGVKLILPFMKKEVADFALSLPLEHKVDEKANKVILRKLACELGLGEHAERKKTAAQYGSGIDKMMEKLAKPKTKTQYLKDSFPLAALFSSGKDSCYAMQKMMQRGFSVRVLVTMKSQNPDSFMFHTPAVELATLQAKAIGVPIIFQETKGEKEKELSDLKKALKLAKEKHKIRGVITGALYSEYQAARIKRVCDELKIACFSPLWHMNQEQEMREIVRYFDVIFTGVAAYGLDHSWLGRKITEKDVDSLAELNKKYGINIAGEGGEFESLVLNAPFFKKKIIIESYNIEEKNENTARLEIRKASLS
ncbi:MAG: diphthine--ammonia ligase [archaeon]